jgi:hypothetical protein
MVNHPERFAPLTNIANALIDFLASTYEVCVDDVSSEEDSSQGLDQPQSVRVCRMIPLRTNEAPLTIVVTSFPSVEIKAGLFFEAVFPPCGCDACDEEWLVNANLLEKTVFSVVNGQLSERISKGHALVSFTDPEMSSTRVLLKDLRKTSKDLKRIRLVLDSLDSGWHEWQPRS